MTRGYVRAWGNFVNLGKLYSIPPWGTVAPFGLDRVQNNSLNLGNLYTYVKHRRPPGWAFFDDGSVFIVPYGWLPHDMFQDRMNIAAQFVKSPSPKIQAIRQEDPRRARLILINKDGRDARLKIFHILARNAHTKQRVSVVDPPFENIVLDLDESGRYPTVARFKDAPQLKFEHRMRNSEALEHFRGTLIDGILQPNVRLGNGLILSSSPDLLSPEVQGRRRLQNREARARRGSVGLPNRAPAALLAQAGVRPSRDRLPPPKLVSPIFAQQQDLQYPEAQSERSSRKRLPPLPSENPSSAREKDMQRRGVQAAQRERDSIQPQEDLLLLTKLSHNHRQRSLRDRSSSSHAAQRLAPATRRSRRTLEAESERLEAKERELNRREGILRWKHKAWILEQKLAMATKGGPPTTHKRHQNEIDVPQLEPKNMQDFSHKKEVSSEPHADNAGDALSSLGFNIDEASPPEALARLRSRIQLPARRTLRSKRMSSLR